MKSLFLFVLIATMSGAAALAQNNLSLPADTLKKGKGYIMFHKTSAINSVEIAQKKTAKANGIYIYFGYPTPVPTSNAIRSNVIGGKMGEKRDDIPLFDKIDIITGKYEDIKVSRDTKYRNLFKLTGLEFPIRLKLKSGLEVVDFEISKAGEWRIEIELKNN